MKRYINSSGSRCVHKSPKITASQYLRHRYIIDDEDVWPATYGLSPSQIETWNKDRKATIGEHEVIIPEPGSKRK